MGHNHNAFSRSKAMFAAIHAIISGGGSVVAQHMALENLGPYTSHGKGGKFGRLGSRPNFDSGSANNNPHQGIRECDRRVRQSVLLA